MSQKKLLTFNEVLEQTEDGFRNLLIGNGFSRSYEDKRFSFKSLLESAVENNIIKKDTPIYNLFKAFGTSDFELIIKQIESSIIVLESYDKVDQETKDKMIIDSKSLKEHLVEVVTNNHPPKANSISDEEYLKCIDFIKRFDNIFSLNYDLLLFWATMRLKEIIEEEDKLIPQKRIVNDKNCRLKVSDGFGSTGSVDEKDYVVFKNDNSNYYQTIHYLHGALHIFDNQHEIIKNTYKRTQKALREQTLENLEKSIYPIFISEGTTHKKLTKIIHNSYLNNSYKTLRTMPTTKKHSSGTYKENSLIIFGTMLKSNDEHIIDAIVKNGVKNIYIGLSSIDKISDFSYLEGRLEGKRKLYFYDYRTVKVWRD